MSETLPCGHRFIGGSRCHGTPDWHDGAAGKHPYQPTDRRSGQERRRAARQPTVDVEALVAAANTAINQLLDDIERLGYSPRPYWVAHQAMTRLLAALAAQETPE